jgi:hypothetical protein
MTENFGSGLMGGVVLIDPETGQAYKAGTDVAEVTSVVVNEVSTPFSATRVQLDATYAQKLVGAKVSARVYTPEQFGASGLGIVDDTQAVRDCFTAANAAARTGVVSTIQHPGAAVQLTGKYNLSSLAAPIDIKCNVLPSQAEFIVPASYAGIAIRVGHLTSGSWFQSADIHIPDVIKPTSSAIVAGSVGVRVQNIGNTTLSFGRIMYFETAQHYTGDNQGAVYLTVFPGYVSYCKTAFKIKPDMAGGWANQIQFIGGGVQQSVGYAGGTRLAGWKHIEIDGNGINNVDQIHFLDTSLEGDVSENWLELARARNITFTGCRHEQGTAGATVTFSASANVTWTAHGLSVGDMVLFVATTNPGGLFSRSPYYVISVVDANTITIGQRKGGTAVTFTSAGSAVFGWRPPRAKLDSSVYLVNVQFELPYMQMGVMEVLNNAAAGDGISTQLQNTRTIDGNVSDDLPLWRARNIFAGASRPLFAAYPPTVVPREDPRGWTSALSDRGVLFAASGAETARLYSALGVLTWQRAGQTAADVATVVRSPSLLAVTALACAANATTTTTFTLTGAAVSDHLLVTVLGVLPAGIIYSHAWVSSANTITVAFANVTAGSINVTQNIQAAAFSRFF